MPLQSGSDAVLRAMRRSYRSDRYLAIIDAVRAAMPAAAITTDIIVGFPGETDADFEQTLQVVERAQFASAFTFQYSKRTGTPAATMPEQVPSEVVRERYDRLILAQDAISWSANRALVGHPVEVLVAGVGRKAQATGRLSGRARDGRLVHVSAGPDVAPGDRGHVDDHLCSALPPRRRRPDHRLPPLAWCRTGSTSETHRRPARTGAGRCP